jgi:hypothetical protein
MAEVIGSDLKSMLYACLNARFREFSILDRACFPAHEFDEKEAEMLCRFCSAIQERGYEFIEPQLVEKTARDTLDLAAEYGAFVDPRVGESYLGVFVVGQMLMQPYAGEGFCEVMMRSQVYRQTTPETKHFARFLMLMATFVPGKYFADKYRETISDESLSEALELKPASLDMHLVMRVLARVDQSQ